MKGGFNNIENIYSKIRLDNISRRGWNVILNIIKLFKKKRRFLVIKLG